MTVREEAPKLMVKKDFLDRIPGDAMVAWQGSPPLVQVQLLVWERLQASVRKTCAKCHDHDTLAEWLDANLVSWRAAWCNLVAWMWKVHVMRVRVP